MHDNRIESVAEIRSNENKEYLCGHCQRGKLFFTIEQINRHISDSHDKEPQLTIETAKKFERQLDVAVVRQDVPAVVKKYFRKLNMKSRAKKLHNEVSEYVCRFC